MLGQLDPCGGGDPIPLKKKTLSVGRRSHCDIALRFPNVSSNHCRLELIDGYWFVRDLGSRNGIRINGRKCESGWLVPGDELRIATHKYVIRYEATGERPPAPVEEQSKKRGVFGQSLLEKAGLVNSRWLEREMTRESTDERPARPNRKSDSQEDGRP